MLTSELPDEVRLSLRLIVASFVVNVLTTALPLFTMSTGWEQLSFAERNQRAAAGASSMIGLVLLLPSLFFLVWLYSSIQKRRKWPRVLLVISCILSVPAILGGLGRLRDDWTGIFVVGAGLLLIIATVLLFRSDASDWFNGTESRPTNASILGA
jgi:hypothetical protein